MAPVVSVVIRSFERGGALIELLEAILRQRDAPPFEVVVVDQSQHMSADHRVRLDQLATADPRLRILRYPPLGGPRARNVGCRAARGELLLFMDDDDLPGDDLWIAKHVENFVDPACLGVSGGQWDPRLGDQPYRNMERARRLVLSWVPVVMWQRVYTMADRRRHVDSLTGANTTIRRSVLERVGLWDECTPIEDELSFNFRLYRARAPGEYLLFDPVPRMVRRRDIPGGMNKRESGVVSLGARLFEYQHRVFRYYFPGRFLALYPVFMVLLFGVCCDCIWSDLHRQGGAARKLATTVALGIGFPLLWLLWMARVVRIRVTQGAPRRGHEREPALRLPA